MNQIIPAVIGLGYVGLPIFLRLNKRFNTLGFDINLKRIKDLKKLKDTNKEFGPKELKIKKKSLITCKAEDLKKSNFYIVTVPTPLYPNKKPDLRSLNSACQLLKKVIKEDDIIFLESTVYPGLTRSLKKKYFNNKKVWFGYSPERINPGDKINTVQNIKKIVSFDDCPLSIKKKITKIYSSISNKIIFTKSIEQAEMSKVIENIQRDINVAFMNEIFMVSEKLNLNFKEVIKLASTKWNFLNFSPGLVGGHCLPVDPFYLYHLAKLKGHDAKFMLAGRIVNDDLKIFIFNKIKNEIINKKSKKVLILGLSYKADVSDIRNSLALDIFLKLKKKFKNKIYAYDPILNFESSKKFRLVKKINLNNYDLVVPLVNHRIFRKEIFKKLKVNKLKFFDVFNFSYTN